MIHPAIAPPSHSPIPSTQSILSRHALVEAWRKFERQFVGDS